MRQQLGLLAWRHGPRSLAECQTELQVLSTMQRGAQQQTSAGTKIEQPERFGQPAVSDCGNATASYMLEDRSTFEEPQSSRWAEHQNECHSYHRTSGQSNHCLLNQYQIRKVPRQHLSSQNRQLTTLRGFAASALATENVVGKSERIFRSRYIPPGGFLALNNIRDNPGAKKEKKRLGRGTGSGLGKTSGRGHKGQKARAGRKPRAGFEGGQTPLRLSIPKRGFHNPFSLDFQVLNLNRLTDYIEKGKIDADNLITMKTLKDAGAIGKAMRDGVKLLGRGSDEFKYPIKIEVSRVSEQARKTIEAAGGTVTTVHYNKLGLRALYKPEWFIKKGRMIPRPARPPPKMRGKTDAIGRLPAPTTPLDLNSQDS